MNDQKEPDLKKELEKKKRELRDVKEHAKNHLKREKNKITREKNHKLEHEDKKLTKELKKMDKKKGEALKMIERRAKKIWRIFDRKQKEAQEDKEKKGHRINREALRAARNAEKITEAEIEHAHKDLISIKARVFSRRRKIINALQFALVIYLFILSVIIIKEVTVTLSSGAIGTITSTVDSTASAFGAGWFTSVIAQSGSVIAILSNSLVGSEVISFEIGFYILLGIALGNTLTPVLASLVIRTKHHWHLRHGFELGLANVIYSIFLVLLVLIIQIPTKVFTSSGDAIASWAETLPAFSKVPDLLSVITSPILNLVRFETWPLVISFLVGVGLLIFSLGRVGKSMFVFLGGKRHTRAIMEKAFSSHWRAFGIGLGLTIIVPSASLLTTLLVPLAVTRIVTLRQAIPYMIGTSVGTFIDVLLASFANAQGYAVAGGIVLTMMASLGILFIFGNYGSTLIYKVTRHLSMHVIKMRRRNILKYIAGFVIIPALIVIIF
ncbi:hypothetical protein ACFL10_00255 [Patescibacteria group bacterium]